MISPQYIRKLSVGTRHSGQFVFFSRQGSGFFPVLLSVELAQLSAQHPFLAIGCPRSSFFDLESEQEYKSQLESQVEVEGSAGVLDLLDFSHF